MSARNIPACTGLAPVGWAAAPKAETEASERVGTQPVAPPLPTARAERIAAEEAHIIASVLAKQRPCARTRPQGNKNIFPLRSSNTKTANVAAAERTVRIDSFIDAHPKGEASVVYFDENRLTYKVFGAPQNLAARAQARALLEAAADTLPREEPAPDVDGNVSSLHAMINAARARRLAQAERSEQRTSSPPTRGSFVARTIEEASEWPKSKAMRSGEQRARNAEYRQQVWLQSIERYERELSRVQDAAGTWERRREEQEIVERARLEAMLLREKQAHWLCFVALGGLFHAWSGRYKQKMDERLRCLRRDLAARKIQRVARRRLLLEINHLKSVASAVIRKYYMMFRWKRNLQKKAKAAAIVRHILGEIAQLSGIKKTIASFRRKVVRCQRHVRRWIAKRAAQLQCYELQFARADSLRVERLRQNARKQVRKFEKDRAIVEELSKALLKEPSPYAMTKEAEAVLKPHKHLVWFKDEVLRNIRARDADLRLLKKAGSYHEILSIVVPTLSFTPVRITHVSKVFAKRLLQEFVGMSKSRITGALDEFVDEMSQYTLRTQQRAVFSSMLDEIKRNPNFNISLVPRELVGLLAEIQRPRRPYFPVVIEPDRLQSLIHEAVMKVHERLDREEGWRCDIGHYEFIAA
jgi:hypothetical protein